MAKRSRQKKFKFLLTIRHQDEDAVIGNIIHEMRYVVGWYHQNTDASRIIQAIVAAPVDEDVKQYRVYLELDEDLQPVDRQHFITRGLSGNNAFHELHWLV